LSANNVSTNDQFLCSICLKVFTDPVTLPCGHNFCRKCIDQIWPINAKCRCPSCKKIFFFRPELKVNTFIAKMTENLEDRVCAVHNKPLELFCNSERMCVCVLCVYSEHKDHEVISLKEASKQQKILMQKAEGHMQEDINRGLKKIAELRGSVGTSHAAADREISEGVKVFTVLKESLERGLELLISEITKKKTDTEEQAEGLIQEIEQEISELENRRAELQKLSQTEDPLSLLQTSSQPPLTPTRDWTSTRGLFQAELKRVKTKKVDITMDTESAQTRVQQTENQINLPDSPMTVSLSDSFYFEAQVKGKTEWTLGVAEESVIGKGSLTLNPQNGFWTIGLKDGAYYVSDNPEISVFTKCRPEKVGVFVDSKEGVVSFYNIDSAAMLYSFTGVTFKESLRPFFHPGHLWDSSSPVKHGTEIPQKLRYVNEQ
uniref:Uncharacterized protein n=1 Tax=Periophthalmus magnuspinnatus TaxID=409849 RepID=A0A3B4ADU6_9GOBI